MKRRTTAVAVAITAPGTRAETALGAGRIPYHIQTTYEGFSQWINTYRGPYTGIAQISGSYANGQTFQSLFDVG